jgi:hypothetical protein
MKTATALTVLAVGAIFAFAVNAHTKFLNFQILGWVLILTAIAGLVIPRRGRGWLRRTVLVKEGRGKAVESTKEGDQHSAADTAPTEADGKVESEGTVERESIVEFMEK